MLEYNEIIKSYVMTNVMFFKNIQLHHLFSSLLECYVVSPPFEDS